MTFQELMKQELGYDCITTFWEDFAIADRFGLGAVRDTFRRAFNEWKTDYKYLTELVLVLNQRSWMHHAKKNTAFMELYSELYDKASQYAEENLKGEEYTYYFNLTD